MSERPGFGQVALARFASPPPLGRYAEKVWSQVPDACSMRETNCQPQRRVLVFTHSAGDTNLIRDILTSTSLAAHPCSSSSEFCEAMRSGADAAVIGDEALAEGDLERLTEAIGEQPAWSDLPVLFLTSATTADHYSQLERLDRLGNVILVERPLRKAILSSALRTALRARCHQYELRDQLESVRKTAEAQSQSEDRYRTLTEALPQLVWSCLPNGDCDYLSRQWVEYTGIPEEEQLGFNWLECVMHPDDKDRVYKAWMAAVAGEAPYDLEFRLRRHDGAFRWFKTRGIAVKDSNGVTQRWFGTCTDIDEQKRAQAERQDLLLREQEARKVAELLYRAGPILSAELDMQKLAQRVTDLATELTGAQFGALFFNRLDEHGESYTLYTLSGAPRSSFENFPLPRNTDVFAPTFHGRRTVRSEDITKDPRYGKNAPRTGMPKGHLPVRSYLAVPVVARSGEVLGGLFFGSAEVGVFTEQHEKLVEGVAVQAAIALDNAQLFEQAQNAKRQLERSNAELRRANEDLNQFAYSASHDLQEPLRMVGIYSQMLERKYGQHLDDEAREYLNYTVQGARRMQMLLKDLLAYTQIVTDAKLTSARTCDAEKALDMALANLRRAIQECGAELARDPLPSLQANQTHLVQLFQNLIGNALKYRGEEPPRIRIGCTVEQGMAQIFVQDNGIGIDAQYSQQVFGIFKRLHTNSKYDGTGIGLAICQKIVERYGGKIWVESEGEGRGSTFWFTLPCVQESDAAFDANA